MEVLSLWDGQLKELVRKKPNGMTPFGFPINEYTHRLLKCPKLFPSE